MTKEEVTTHCEEIIGWIKAQQPRMPNAYIGTVNVPVDDWCHGCDDFMTIIIDNGKGLVDSTEDGKCRPSSGPCLRVWFATTADEVHNYECHREWELHCGLDYMCALVANWKTVKQKINDLIEERISDINHASVNESRMCARITEFEL